MFHIATIKFNLALANSLVIVIFGALSTQRYSYELKESTLGRHGNCRDFLLFILHLGLYVHILLPPHANNLILSLED